MKYLFMKKFRQGLAGVVLGMSISLPSAGEEHLPDIELGLPPEAYQTSKELVSVKKTSQKDFDPSYFPWIIGGIIAGGFVIDYLFGMLDPKRKNSREINPYESPRSY
jgi:hypothetical protein